jgi:signal transduction histidine kinase
MQLDAAEVSFFDDVQQSYHRVTAASQLARDTLDEARRSVQNLRPGALETNDFPSAFATTVKQLGSNATVYLDTKVSGTPFPLTQLTQENVLRIAQEAVRNAIRHAHPKNISVELHFDSSALHLKVKDDGSGFNPNAAAPDGHFGLTGMRERVEQMNGKMEIESVPGQGTTISVEVKS